MRAKREYEFGPEYAVPPGATLHEVMEFMQMSQKELAQRTGLTERTLPRILNSASVATESISPDFFP
ncbi:helix-turn-helix domain-containing protein [Desulfobulbus propionicus]